MLKSEELNSEKPERFSKWEKEIIENRVYLINMCRKFLGPRHAQMAEDLAQEAMIKAVRGVHKFEGRSSLRSWLARIAINEVKNYFRRSKPEFLQDEIKVPVNIESANLESAENPTADDIEKNLAFIDVEQGMEKLPQTDQDIIKMLLMGFNEKEIAQSLNILSGTAKSRIFRARARLRKILGAAV